MPLLDNYFSSLQADTGAQGFVLVRDDPLLKSNSFHNPPSPPKICDGRRTKSWSVPQSRRKGAGRRSSETKSSSSRREFQGNSLDYLPPCPPRRKESQDDLFVYKRFQQQQQSQRSRHNEDSDNRFDSLFGSRVVRGGSKNAEQRSAALCKLNNYDFKGFSQVSISSAPKFPMRKGSRDDLSTLPRRKQFSPGSTVNQKIELSEFLDEVTNVLGDMDSSEQSGSGRRNPLLSSPVCVGSFEENSNSNDTNRFISSQSWLVRPSSAAVGGEERGSLIDDSTRQAILATSTP